MSDVRENKVQAGSAGYQLDRILKALWPDEEGVRQNSDFLSLSENVRKDLLNEYPSKKQGDEKYPFPHRLHTDALEELVSRIGHHFGDPVDSFSDGVSRGTVMMTMIELAVYHTPSESLMRRHLDGETNFYNSGKQTITTDGWRIIADSVSNLESGDEDLDTDDPTESEEVIWEVKEVILSDMVREDYTCIIDGKERTLDIPPWQRPGGAWKQKKAKDELIDTIERGLPLPPVFGWERPEGVISIVDGQQRIEVLRERIQDWSEHGDYKIVMILLNENMEFDDLRALYHRLNQSGRRLTSTELTLLTYHETPLAKALIHASRNIIRSCRTEEEEEDWMRHLVENVIFRGSSIDIRRSILRTSDSDLKQPITRHELAIYKVLMRVCAYSLKNQNNSLIGHNKSTIAAAKEAFKEYIGKQDEEASQFVNEVLEGMKKTHEIFGSKAFTLNGKHHEFALAVQVSGIMQGGILLSNEAADETREKWDRFIGGFDELRQNSKTIWGKHDEWREIVGLILDPLRLSRQVTWEQEIAQRLVGLPDEDVEMMRRNFLSGS